MSDDAQRRDYGNKSGESKVESTKGGSQMKASGGSATGGNSGPTGSPRTYPKGGKPSMRADFNPQADKACDYAVGGV